MIATRRHPRDVGRAVLALLGLTATAAGAQTITSTGVPGKGHGSIGIAYQQLQIHRRTVPSMFGGGFENFGEITRRSMHLGIDYGLGERLALSASLPFKSNRYRGSMGHNPQFELIDDHGQRFLDDGAFHSTWGDWMLGLRYQWLNEPVAVTPFVSYSRPSHDYALFTETQAGAGQWRIDTGVNLGSRLPRPMQNVYWQFGYAYSTMQKTRPRGEPARRVNHSTVNLEVGWLASPALTVRANVTYLKTHNALAFPQDFVLPAPGAPTGDLWYYHDQLFPWGGTVGSLGIRYAFNDHYSAFIDHGRSLHVSFGHKYENIWTSGITRSF